jgi:hypothetical protein
MGHYIEGFTSKSLKYNPRPFQPTRQFRDDSLGRSSLNKQLGMEEDWMVGVDYRASKRSDHQWWFVGGIMSGLGFVVVKSNKPLYLTVGSFRCQPLISHGPCTVGPQKTREAGWKISRKVFLNHHFPLSPCLQNHASDAIFVDTGITSLALAAAKPLVDESIGVIIHEVNWNQSSHVVSTVPGHDGLPCLWRNNDVGHLE